MVWTELISPFFHNGERKKKIPFDDVLKGFHYAIEMDKKRIGSKEIVFESGSKILFKRGERVKSK